MNVHNVEGLYINVYLAWALIQLFTVFNGFYKYDTQLYNMICFASDNINNFLFFNNAYINVPVCAILEPIKPVVIPYEHKYLDKVRSIPNNYVFSSDETQILNDKIVEISIEQKELQMKLVLEEEEEEEDSRIQLLSPDDVINKARDYVINARLNTLINNMIMENTPLGNVIMTYDNNRETFNFYSDNMIPYRYLETVARKYVITYNCRPLYIDMEEELKIYEKKMLEQDENNEKTTQPPESKKNVFAKFKSYNTEGKTGHVGKVAGPQNSVQNKDTGDKTKNRKIILKDKANRYSCQGKINNFSIIKRPEKKLLSKKLVMTFADFKQKSKI
jgi:hypothetical protein